MTTEKIKFKGEFLNANKNFIKNSKEIKKEQNIERRRIMRELKMKNHAIACLMCAVQVERILFFMIETRLGKDIKIFTKDKGFDFALSKVKQMQIIKKNHYIPYLESLKEYRNKIAHDWNYWKEIQKNTEIQKDMEKNCLKAMEFLDTPMKDLKLFAQEEEPAFLQKLEIKKSMEENIKNAKKVILQPSHRGVYLKMESAYLSYLSYISKNMIIETGDVLGNTKNEMEFIEVVRTIPKGRVRISGSTKLIMHTTRNKK